MGDNSYKCYTHNTYIIHRQLETDCNDEFILYINLLQQCLNLQNKFRISKYVYLYSVVLFDKPLLK